MANPRLRARSLLSEHPYAWWLAAFALAGIAGLAYWPGTAGGFLFDDYANLPALGRYGGVRDAQTLLYYLTSGIADPTGRPVSMLSFLVDARNWPADPYPFKRTNIVLHALNGLLLYATLAALGRRLSSDMVRVRTAALLAAALWLLHPLWASTVLYVVQRHAMLAAFFVMAGIRAWIASRNAFDQGRSTRGWLLAILSVPVFGTLAGLGKANGFLLPLLLVVLELTVLRGGHATGRGRRWASRLLVWLPALLLLAWLGWYALQTGLDGTRGRAFTLEQRLLSQPRALLDYLRLLLVPGLDARGVFADGFAVSRSWLDPWTTLLAVLALCALAAGAWLARSRAAVFAAGAGFFLAGHAMESGVVMLEPYFEHRNYLPAMLLFWPLAWWAARPGRLRHLLLAGLIGYAGLMLLATAAQARLWGDPLGLAIAWADANPDSARAQTHAFHQERAAGREEAAERRLHRLLDTEPEEPQFALNLLGLRCQQGRATGADVEAAARAMAASGGLAKDINYHWLSAALAPGNGAACSTLPEPALERLLTAATSTAPSRRREEYEAREWLLRGDVALRRRDCETALVAFDARMDIQPRPEYMQAQVARLATLCGPEPALLHLQRYLDAGLPVAAAASPMLRLRDRVTAGFWTAHWRDLQRLLAGEAAGNGTPGTARSRIVAPRDETLPPPAAANSRTP